LSTGVLYKYLHQLAAPYLVVMISDDPPVSAVSLHVTILCSAGQSDLAVPWTRTAGYGP